MPKSKAKRQKTTTSSRPVALGGPAKPSDRRWNYAIAAVVAIAIAYGGYAWWDSTRSEEGFIAIAEGGQEALQQVDSFASQGRRHLSPGEDHYYDSDFPTSGPHETTWTEPGVYQEPQRPTQLVHALEHGNIVIYYDAPGDATMDQLEEWAALYDGQWSGLVVTPRAGLGESVVLTAWTKRLDLDSFDPAAAAAFIDAYRGRGPEHPVR